MPRPPVVADFDNLKVEIVTPPPGDSPTNVLLLLHGLGDSLKSFTNLARQMRLPETVCVVVQGPHNLLEFGGFHWGDDVIFDSATGDLDPDAGFEKTTANLTRMLTDVLQTKCGYKLRDIMMFGYGQGGMAALNLAAMLHQSSAASSSAEAELGGVISVGSGMPSAFDVASLKLKSRTPVLVCAGNDLSAVNASEEDKLARVFDSVQIKRYRRPGDGMPRNRDEMLPIMQMFARRLKSTKGVFSGSTELT